MKIVLTILLFLVSACAYLEKQESPPRTVWDGVYLSDQAERGAKIYIEQCVACHAANMRGGPGSRSIVGIEFQFIWKDKTLGELFEAVRTKMPPGRSGILSDQQYIDVLTTILKGNGFPAGEDKELPANLKVLEDILITWSKP